MDKKAKIEIENKFKRAEELMKENLDQALSELQRIDPKTLPDDLKCDYYYLAGDIYYDRDDFDDAIICYNLALKNTYLDNEDRAEIYSNLASIYFDKKLYKDAIHYSGQATRISKQKQIITKALKIAGLAYENLKEFKEAIEQFLQILKIYNEKRTDSWSKYMIESSYGSLAMSYWKDGNGAMSESYCDRLFLLKDVDSRELSKAYLCKAHRLYEKRQWKEALDHYNKAISLMDNEEEKHHYQKYIDDCKGWLAKQ